MLKMILDEVRERLVPELRDLVPLREAHKRANAEEPIFLMAPSMFSDFQVYLNSQGTQWEPVENEELGMGMLIYIDKTETVVVYPDEATDEGTIGVVREREFSPE